MNVVDLFLYWRNTRYIHKGMKREFSTHFFFLSLSLWFSLLVISFIRLFPIRLTCNIVTFLLLLYLVYVSSNILSFCFFFIIFVLPNYLLLYIFFFVFFFSRQWHYYTTRKCENKQLFFFYFLRSLSIQCHSFCNFILIVRQTKENRKKNKDSSLKYFCIASSIFLSNNYFNIIYPRKTF